MWEKVNENALVSPREFRSDVEGLEKVMRDSHLGFLMNGEGLEEVFFKR